PLRDAAVQLPRNDHGIDHSAEVVHRNIGYEMDRAAIWIDLDLGNVGAAGIGEIYRIVECLGFHARLKHVDRKIHQAISRTDHVAERFRPVGSLHGERSIFEYDVTLTRLEHMRGDLGSLRDDLVGGLGQRGTTYGQRSRAIGAQSELHPVGVAEYDLNLVGGNGQFFRHDLRKSRLVALAVVVRPDQHGDIAGDVDPHRGAFEDARTGAERLDDARRRQAACLHVGGKTDAPEFAARLRFFLAPGKTAPVGDLQRLFEAGFRVATVVFDDHRRLIGILRRINHVLAPDLNPVDLHLAGRDIDETLQQEGRFGTAGTTIGVDRHRVGEHAFDFAMNRGRGVDAAQQQAVEVGRDVRAERREVAAHISDGAHLQAEELAGFV